MISKFIIYGKDCSTVLKLMEDVFDYYVICGVKNNIPLLRDIIQQPAFVEGDISTNFLAETYPEGFPGFHLSDSQFKQLVASAAFFYQHRFLADQDFTAVADMAPFYHESLAVTVNGEVHTVSVVINEDGSLTVSLDGGDEVTISEMDFRPGNPVFQAKANGEAFTVQYVEHKGHHQTLSLCGTDFDITVRTAEEQRCFEILPPKQERKADNYVATPMPGTLISLSVAEGDVVFEGQEVAVVEAMKMQNQILAPRAGKVKKVHVVAGATLDDEQFIIELEDEGDAAEEGSAEK
jgi:propionyl-CoA carboxylase alpha chain